MTNLSRRTVAAVALGAISLGSVLVLGSANDADAGNGWAVSEAQRVDAPGRRAFADDIITKAEYDAAFDRTMSCLRAAGLTPTETTATKGVGLRQYAVPATSDGELARVDRSIEACGGPLRPIEAAFVAAVAPRPGSAARRAAEQRATSCLGVEDPRGRSVDDLAAELARRGVVEPVGRCLAAFQAEAPTPIPGADQLATAVDSP